MAEQGKPTNDPDEVLRRMLRTPASPNSVKPTVTVSDVQSVLNHLNIVGIDPLSAVLQRHGLIEKLRAWLSDPSVFDSPDTHEFAKNVGKPLGIENT